MRTEKASSIIKVLLTTKKLKLFQNCVFPVYKYLRIFLCNIFHYLKMFLLNQSRAPFIFDFLKIVRAKQLKKNEKGHYIL